MKKLIKKWLWLPGFISFFVGVFPELLKVTPAIRIGLLIGGMTLIIVWAIVVKIFSYLKKQIKYFRVRRKKIRVGISIDDADLNQDIVNYCNEEVKKIKLERKIIFQKYEVSSKDLKRVHKNISKKNSTLDLVVWMTRKNSNKGKVPINFTYKNTHDNLIATIVHNQMSSLVSIEKMFNFNKDTFIVDLQIEKENITNFSLFIVAICTTVFRGNKEGIFIFEKLISKLKDNKSTLKNEVSDKLGTLYMITGGDLLAKEKFPESLKILNKGYGLIPRNRDLLAGRALAQFLNGDEDGAEATANELVANNTNFPVAHLDIAFFRIKKKKYKNAIKHYSIFARYNQDGRVTIDVINFFSKRIDENPSELGYLFARGFLKRTLSKDPKLTKVGESDYVDDFKTFIRRAQGKSEYKDMLDVAQKYLDKVSK